MWNVQVVNAGRSRGARREMRVPAFALAVLAGLVAPAARAQSNGASLIQQEKPLEAPPPPPEVPADAPTVTPAPDIRVSTPNRAASLTPETGASDQQVYAVKGSRVTAFSLIGVPLTWGLASLGAVAGGMAGFFAVLSLSSSSSLGSTGAISLSMGGAFAAGSLVGVLITYQLLPHMMSLFCDDAKMTGSVQAARDRGWTLGRWGVLGMAVTSAGMIVGGLSNNQALFTTSLLGWTVSYLIAWGLEIAGVIDGYSRSYRPRSAPSGAVPSEALPSGDDRL